MTPEERNKPEKLPATLRPYFARPLHSKSGNDKTPRNFDGEMWTIPSGSWRYSESVFQNLIEAKRIVREKTVLRAIRYRDDFPYEELTSNWTDTGPGDLVLDPTCGSGTDEAHTRRRKSCGARRTRWAVPDCRGRMWSM